jgi:hypothetical protein
MLLLEGFVTVMCVEMVFTGHFKAKTTGDAKKSRNRTVHGLCSRDAAFSLQKQVICNQTPTCSL